MKLDAIVFTSQTGFTRQYAGMLGQALSLPVYALEEAASQLPGGSRILYLGWVHASHVKGYRQAAKRFSVCAVCGVGLCDTGTLTAEVRQATAVPEEIPVFTLQGGIERKKLKGIDKLMISMLAKGLASQKQRSPRDERMLELLSRDGCYVSRENLTEILDWYEHE